MGFLVIVRDFRVTQEALVFIQRVLLAVQAAFILELRLAKPTAVFIARMLSAPEASLFPLRFIAYEAGLTIDIVRMGVCNYFIVVARIAIGFCFSTARNYK
jgi:hypothetical protein